MDEGCTVDFYPPENDMHIRYCYKFSDKLILKIELNNAKTPKKTERKITFYTNVDTCIIWNTLDLKLLTQDGWLASYYESATVKDI